MDVKAVSAILLNLLDEVIHNVINGKKAESILHKLESRYITKNLTNKLYMKKHLYDLQMEENIDQLEHLNKFNTLNIQLNLIKRKKEKKKKKVLIKSYVKLK